jgi:uronate dehydrogenase
VIHLAGVPREDAWEPILRGNIVATYNLFEAARQNGVRRMIFASTNHVTGFYRADEEVDTGMPVRPDSRYAVSKVFGEALGRLYADKHGMEVACLRIGSFRYRPQTLRQLATWMSPRDFVELVRCCLEAPQYHFIVLYGVSANTRTRWRDEARKVVGFVPRDNAELFAGQLDDALSRIGALFHGGDTCEQEFTGNPDAVP